MKNLILSAILLATCSAIAQLKAHDEEKSAVRSTYTKKSLPSQTPRTNLGGVYDWIPRTDWIPPRTDWIPPTSK